MEPGRDPVPLNPANRYAHTPYANDSFQGAKAKLSLSSCISSRIRSLHAGCRMPDTTSLKVEACPERISNYFSPTLNCVLGWVARS